MSVLESTPVELALKAILPVAATYFILRFIQWAASVLRWMLFDHNIRYKSYNKISEDLYNYVFQQNIAFYANTMPGKIASQINQIADSYKDLIDVVFGTCVAISISVIIASNEFLMIGWEYMVLIIFALAFRIIWGLCTMKQSLNSAAKRAQSLNHLQGRQMDAVSNFPAVKLFARAQQEQKSLAPIRKNYEMTARKAHYRSRIFWAPGNLMMDTICFALLILLCGYMYSIGRSSLADVSFVIATYTAVSSMGFFLIRTLKDFIDKWGNAVGSYNTLIQPLTITDAPNADKLVVKKGMIEIRNVDFKYNKKLVINNLSLTIRPGEKIGLVGMSGAGKTTLVNLLMRLYDPVHGSILIDGQDIKNVTQDSLREQIAFIPQEPTMFNRTLQENIGYGKEKATNKEILKAAKQASADTFIQETPNKYDTIVGDRGIKLSGGQRQRIAIARAFLKDAPILILDEATSALDSDTESAIQTAFDKLSKGRTTIAIAHRLSTLRNMDRIVVIDKGRIVEMGTHLQLLRKKHGIYAHLWKMQSDGFIQE